MSNIKMTMPLSSILVLPDKKGINNDYVNIMLEEDIPVFCVNQKANKKRFLPFSFLNKNKEYFWLYDGDVEFYLTENCFNKLKEKVLAKKGVWNIEWKETKEEKPKKQKIEVSYGDELKVVAKLTTEEKIARLTKKHGELYSYLNQKSPDKGKVTRAFVDTTTDAALINHAALEEVIDLADEEAKKYTQKIVNITGEMVKSSVKLMAKDVFNNELMNVLVRQSNGTIIHHITRVYLNCIAFLSYYNSLFSTSAIQKIRTSFISKYRIFYQKLLPHIKIDDINLEQVFYGGMQPISAEMFSNWAIGFLLHDIGKAEAIEYHEGENRYDRDIVMAHVTTGYKSIMTKTNYPVEAGLITGYHHEYYGDPDGYGYYRTGLQQLKKQRSEIVQDICIAYEHKPVTDFKVLAYFPAKVLEIVDVFDSLTDTNRVYRKGMPTEEALTFMRQNFILKKQKIDLILFDIFTDFIRKKHKTVRK